MLRVDHQRRSIDSWRDHLGVEGQSVKTRHHREAVDVVWDGATWRTVVLVSFVQGHRDVTIVGRNCRDGFGNTGFSPVFFGGRSARNRLLVIGSHAKLGLNSIRIDPRDTSEGAEPRFLRDCGCDIAAARANANSEDRQALRTRVVLQKGHRIANIFDLSKRIFKLPWLTTALAESSVIEGERGEAPRRQRTCVGTGCLFFDGGERTCGDDDASRRRRRQMQESDHAFSVALKFDLMFLHETLRLPPRPNTQVYVSMTKGRDFADSRTFASAPPGRKQSSIPKNVDHDEQAVFERCASHDVEYLG